MTAQQVLKAFMESLANHGYAQPSGIGTKMLDEAIRASSRYRTIQEVIDAMKADQIAAEKEAVAEIFVEEKLLSELTDEQRNDQAKNHPVTESSNAYANSANDGRTTVENYLKERKAYIFLEKYCGIILPKKHWFNEKGIVNYWDSESSGNNDTGAITGSDAGGSATEKTDRSIVPETYINTYKAANGASAQTIVTNKRDWVIQATDNADVITSNGADSINAGAGDDQITANADGATITSGTGNDFITVTESVTDVTLSDLNADDTLTISGTFEAGSAQIEDTLLVISDKTGKRKIRLGDLDSAGNVNINVGSVSTKIAEWLLDAGIDLDLAKTKTTKYSDGKVIGSSSGNISAEVLGESSGEGDGRTAIDPDYTPTDPPVDKTKDPVISKRGIKSTKGTLNSGAVPENLTVNGVAVTKTGKDDTDRDVSEGGNVIGTLSSEFPEATTFTRNGLTIHLLGESSSTGSPTNNGTSAITPKTYSELTTDQKTILAGLFKWWGNECLKLNEESYDISFNSPTTMVKDIGLYFFDGTNSNTLATVWNWQRSGYDGYATQLMLNVNMEYYKDLSADNVDGESSVKGAGFLDRTLAHEFTHAVMAANVNYFNSLPKFIKEGIAELTHGIDDERGKVIFEIASDATQLDGSLQLSNTGTGSQAVGDGYAGGFMFLRYLAKTAAAQTATAPAYGEITATVNLSGDGFYYVDPSTSTPPRINSIYRSRNSLRRN